MKPALSSLLLSSSSITNIVGTKIHWNMAPQGTLAPYITLRGIGQVNDMHMNGVNKLQEGRVQCDCYGKTFGQAQSISNALNALLNGYRSGGFRLIQDDGERDLGAGTQTDGGVPVHLISHDFIINWSN